MSLTNPTVAADHDPEAANFRRAHPMSASQIDTARLCLRKWGYQKLDKLLTPPNKYAARFKWLAEAGSAVPLEKPVSDGVLRI